MVLAVVTARLLGLASIFHKGSIITFGYFIPALSSVKAVVHKDSEAFFQWSTYWLILHLYSTILSPILHISFHPIFQLLSILWLSLPRFQGASFVYERVVRPWVKKYEERVDGAIDDAQRSLENWIWSRAGYVMALVIGESGNVLEIFLELIFGRPDDKSEKKVNDEKKEKPRLSQKLERKKKKSSVSQSQSSVASASTFTSQARHSVKDALRQTNSLEDFVIVDGDGNVEHSMELMAEYLNDFKAMMQQGLYVFANVETCDATNDDSSDDGGDFRLGVFSYSVNNTGGAFMVTPVGAEDTTVVTLPLNKLVAPICSGTQGIILHVNDNDEVTVRAEIVLSSEDDRDTLFNCLTKCLPWMRV